MNTNWKKILNLLLPVAAGFVVSAIVLAVLKSRFGIEIGDPVDLAEEETA